MIMNVQLQAGYSNLAKYSIVLHDNECPTPSWIFKHGRIFDNDP
jgi:hypothetical protein